LDRSTPIDWDILYGCAQTHQKIPSHKPISAIQTGYNSIKFLRSFFQKATVSPKRKIRTHKKTTPGTKIPGAED
jgi:hypothetical protein